MKQIELENWDTSPNNSQAKVYIGQREAQEVFTELEHRLESIGMLPDEYFLLDSQWENGKEIPRGAEIFSTVQYGGSEGIYLDVSISWHEESGKHVSSFATGKTLGESESHLDRMYLTASAINKSLYSNNPHAGYVTVGGGAVRQLEDSVLHLSGAERQLMIDSLIETRNTNPQDKTAVEQLLRRVAGSITEFVNEVGARPLQISDYDMAVLAIQDGNLAVFNDVYKKLPDRMDALLICAAARPGKVGLNMTASILQEARGISNEAYFAACKNAVAAGNVEKALMLADNADKCVTNLDRGLYGRVIEVAISEHKMHIARALVKQCTSEQMQAANPYILVQAVYSKDSQLAFAIAEKKIDATLCAPELIRSLKYNNIDWMLKSLYERGMELKGIPAMQACINLESVEMGQTLIDRGMNFKQFEQIMAGHPDFCKTNDTFIALKQFWETSNPPAKTQNLAKKMQAANEKVKAQEKQSSDTKSSKQRA